MNLKIIIISVFLFLPFSQLLAQYIPMVEEGKFWIYLNHQNQDFPTPESGHAITFLEDTIINSLNYKKVYKLDLKGEHCTDVNEYPCWDFDYPYQTKEKKLISFIREDTTENKVYNLPVSNNFCKTEEYLLFDYSLNVGDTLNSCLYETISASYANLNPGGIVDSIKVVEAYSKLRNTIFTYGFHSVIGLPFETEILINEGIGFKEYGIFYRSKSSFVDYCEGEIDQCELILSTSSIEKNQTINIFPNPSKGIFQILLEEEKIELIKVYSLLGELKTEFRNTDNIDISDFPRGVYFLEIITKNDERIVKKVLKEN